MATRDHVTRMPTRRLADVRARTEMVPACTLSRAAKSGFVRSVTFRPGPPTFGH
jgi:hypothetical protein